MTDRHDGYIVTLDRDVHEDDAQEIINALKMIKGIVAVDPIKSDIGTLIAKQHAKYEIINQIYEVLK